MIESDFIDYLCGSCQRLICSPSFFVGTVNVCRHCGHRTIVPKTSIRLAEAGHGGPNGNDPENFGDEVQYEIRDGQFYATILELADEITPEEVKKAYKRQLMRYHPDRVQHLGHEFSELADQKTKLINEAYDFFRQLGFA